MDNSRKNDSIATKTHPTTANQQREIIYDQANQKSGEMSSGAAGATASAPSGATTGAASKTETTEKMPENIGGGVQRDQSSVDTTGIVKKVLVILW